MPPSGYFRSWTEVCRAVGGQGLEFSTLNSIAIEDLLSILAICDNPFKDVPGKYWDLSPLGRKLIVDLTKVFISIKEREFTNGKLYLISPLKHFLNPDRDTSWYLAVDSMTALECIHRGLGPHTVDIANFLITHGVRFGALQPIKDFSISKSPPVRPQCPSLGHRPVNHHFDLADFAGYEALRDSFFHLQPHVLREGGIIARLAREVLPNSNSLSGPSSEALDGHRARFVCGDEIYVDDDILEPESRLICGSYVLAHNDKGMKIFPQLSC